VDPQRVNLATKKAGKMAGRMDQQQPKRLPIVAVEATVEIDLSEG
jgi:hypothetical protein